MFINLRNNFDIFQSCPACLQMNYSLYSDELLPVPGSDSSHRLEESSESIPRSPSMEPRQTSLMQDSPDSPTNSIESPVRSRHAAPANSKYGATE
jgi:hypothetical protein